jgi:glycogen phosphorylase
LALTPELGWSIGDGQEHGEDPAWDAAEAEMLYDRLETEVIPEFCKRDGNGIPTAWVARMRESMARLTPGFLPNVQCVSTLSNTTYPPRLSTVTARPKKARLAVN